MKNVLLIGDSIRMGYQDEVVKNLKEDFKVFTPAENCKFARYTYNSLRYYLDECGVKPDIVHWNNGLWDTAHIYGKDECFTSVDEYIRDMENIFTELRKTGAKIILATITPTNPLKENHPNSKHFNSDIVEYNLHLVETFCDKVDMINDLHSLVAQNIDEYICEDLIHLTESGKKLCGGAVAQAIKNVTK